MDITEKFGGVLNQATSITSEFEEFCSQQLFRLSSLVDHSVSFDHSVEISSLWDSWRSGFNQLCELSRPYSNFYDAEGLAVYEYLSQSIEQLRLLVEEYSAKLLGLFGVDLFSPDDLVAQPQDVESSSSSTSAFCFYCGSSFMPVVSVAPRHSAVLLTQYCSDECWRFHSHGLIKDFPEAA